MCAALKPHEEMRQYTVNVLKLMRGEIGYLGLAYLFFLIGKSSLDPLLPIYMKYLGASALLVGLIFSISNLVKVIPQYFTGYISDKVGRKAVICLGFGLSALAAFAYSLVDDVYVFAFFIMIASLGFSMR